MKNKYGLEWWSNESGCKLIKSLMDNGDWEYDRVGIGKDKKGLFLVDVDDINEEWRVVNRVKEGLNVEDVLKVGVECGVFEVMKDGYDKNDDYRWNEESGDKEMERFCKKVLIDGEWKDDLFSFMEGL